jgi:predicted PurR-regulated permease PerM
MRFSTHQRRALNWAALVLGVGALFWLLAPVLAPFVIGAVLAYALHPAVEKLASIRVPRLLAVIMVEIAAAFAFAALALLIVPILSKELPLLRDQLPLLVERIDGTVTPWLAQMGVHASLDPTSLRSFLLKYLDTNWDDSIAKALVSARIGGSIVVAIFGYVVLIPVVLFYLLIEWPLHIERGIDLVPPRMRGAVASFARDCDTVLGQYLRGQLLVMLILAAYYSVGLALVGFELAVPVGVFTGLAIFVPYVGFGIGLALALLAGALQFMGWYGPVAVLAVYGIGQIVEGMFLTPKLVGKRIGMSPLTVIFALFTFGHLFGFVGVVIALPVSALIAVAAARLRTGYAKSSLYLG